MASSGWNNQLMKKELDFFYILEKGYMIKKKKMFAIIVTDITIVK